MVCRYSFVFVVVTAILLNIGSIVLLVEGEGRM